MSEQFKDNRAGQKGGIHENAFSERKIVRNGSRLAECQRDGVVGGPGLRWKGDGEIADGKRRLADLQDRIAGGIGGEGDLPWPEPGAPMLDSGIRDDVKDQGNDQRRCDMFQHGLRPRAGDPRVVRRSIRS